MDKLTIDEACAKYGFEKKRLIGLCLRNDGDDPLVVEMRGDEYLVLDDHRLQNAAKRLPPKANTSQGQV